MADKKEFKEKWTGILLIAGGILGYIAGVKEGDYAIIIYPLGGIILGGFIGRMIDKQK